MSKLKVYKIIFVIIIILIIIIGLLVALKYINISKNEKMLENVVASIYGNVDTSEITNNVSIAEMKNVSEIDEEIQGNKVVGIIKIPKIGIEYPILEKTTVDTLNISITKFWGNKINEFGNVTLAGHNRLDGTMFGKVKQLENGDKIQLIDAERDMVEYEVYDKYVTDPNDISCIMSKNDNEREVTLITCTNGNKNRLIIKASEI